MNKYYVQQCQPQRVHAAAQGNRGPPFPPLFSNLLTYIPLPQPHNLEK
jgi:hypothetical protein